VTGDFSRRAQFQEVSSPNAEIDADFHFFDADADLDFDADYFNFHVDFTLISMPTPP
jgi:hypothetical protein